MALPSWCPMRVHVVSIKYCGYTMVILYGLVPRLFHVPRDRRESLGTRVRVSHVFKL